MTFFPVRFIEQLLIRLLCIQEIACVNFPEDSGYKFVTRLLFQGHW